MPSRPSTDDALTILRASLSPRPTAPRDQRARLVQPWLAAFSGEAVRLAMQVASFALLARFLGAETFGVRVALAAVSALAAPLAGFGFANLLIRNVAREPDGFAESWGNALLATVVTGAMAIAAALAVVVFVLPEPPPISVAAAVFIADLFFGRVAALAGTAFQAGGRIADMARSSSVFQAARLLAVVVCVAANPASSRLSWWANTWAVGSCLASAVILLGAWRRLGRGRVSLSRIRAEWRDGLQFVLSPYTQVVNSDADKLILGQYVPPGVLGAYGAAYRVLSAAHVPLQSLFTVTYPMSFAHGAHGIGGARRFAGQVARFALPTGALASATVLLGGHVIGLLLGPGFADMAVILRWLAIVPLLKAIQFLFADALTGAGFQGRRTAIQAAAAVSNVALNCALDPSFGWLGAVVATLTSELMLAVVLAVEALRIEGGACGKWRESGPSVTVPALED